MPCECLFTGFFFILEFWQPHPPPMHHAPTIPPNSQIDDHDNPPRPPCPLHQHGSVFLQLSHQQRAYLSFLYNTMMLCSCQSHMKCQNMRVVKNHPRVSCPLSPPSHSARCGMNKDDPQPPHATGNKLINAEMPPALPECASALPGDVGDDWVQLCTRFRQHPPPGSPTGLLGRFQGCRVWASSRYAGAAHIFCTRSVDDYIMYCSTIRYIIYFIIYNMCVRHRVLVVQ